MNDIITEYYKLIERDREYLKKCVLKISETDSLANDFLINIIENTFMWRKIKNVKTLEKVIESKNAMELLRIEDYYNDELCELLEQYLEKDFSEIEEEEIEKIFSHNNLQVLLNEKNTPQRIKDCINIYMKCEKVCKELYIYIKENCKNTDYNILEETEQFDMKDIKEYLGEIKKCAIFIHSSIDNPKIIEEKKEKLEKFCKEKLETNEYEIFIEIGSFLKERLVFENMLERFEEKEFSHLIVTDIGQIYKLSYDMDKALKLADKIQDMNVTIVSVDERRIIEGRETLEEEIESI